MEELHRVHSLPDQRQKISEYTAFCERASAAKDVAGLRAAVNHLLSDEVREKGTGQEKRRSPTSPPSSPQPPLPLVSPPGPAQSPSHPLHSMHLNNRFPWWSAARSRSS
jgi:hypothetical protein